MNRAANGQFAPGSIGGDLWERQRQLDAARKLTDRRTQIAEKVAAKVTRSDQAGSLARVCREWRVDVPPIRLPEVAPGIYALPEDAAIVAALEAP